jgi:hypothetical protein
MSKFSIISVEHIQKQILVIRGMKVMLDRDLAALYGVPTKRLNESVKRNMKRFPESFMFQLGVDEKNEVVANCDRLKPLKFSTTLPYAFTEYGVVMLSSILNSELAIALNIHVVRAFVDFRYLPEYKTLVGKVEQIEKKIMIHDDNLRSLFQTFRSLILDQTKARKLPPSKSGF